MYKIRTITKAEEAAFMRRWHYSRKTVTNSAVRFGAFHGTKLVGVASFGRIINCVPIFSCDKNNRSGLEINRLAMVDEAPKNSESWFLMRCVYLLRKQYPWLKYIHTWADGARCQGGTIYKACGFLYLRKIKITGIFILPDGSTMHQIGFDQVYLKKYYPMLKDIKGTLSSAPVPEPSQQPA